MDPGQDQEPWVVDHQRQVLLAQLRRPPMKRVARRELPCRGGEAKQGERPAVAVVNGVAHLGADQGLVSEVVVAGDELVPPLALAGATHDGAHLQRGGPRRGWSGPGTAAARCPVRRRWAGAGPVVPWAAAGRSHRRGGMASMVTLAIMSLTLLSGLNQPMRRQNSLDRAWRFSGGGPAISARSSAISSAVKSRP